MCKLPAKQGANKRVYAHTSGKKRKKLDPHSRECLIIGYYDTENVFNLFDTEAKAMIKYRDAIFFEDISRLL